MNFAKIYLAIQLLFLVQIGQAQDNPFANLNVPTPNTTAFLKHVDVPVDLSRGVANISVPIHTIGHGDIQIPISLNYNASGIKVGETASWVGMNWNLNVGGIIHRTIKGVPDEHSGGYFTTADNLAAGFEYEEPNAYTVSEIVNGYIDGEPDLFSFSFPGYSGKFYINENLEPVLVPTQDLKIEFEFNGTAPDSERLKKFIITAPNGVKYHFGENEQTGERITDFHRYSFNSGAFNPYSDIPIAWHLVKIESQTHRNHYYIEYIKQVFEFHSIYTASYGEYYGSLLGSLNNPRFQPSFNSSQVDYVGNESTTYVPFRISCAETNESVQFNAITTRQDIGQISAHAGKQLDRITISNSKGIACKKFEFAYDYYQTANYNPNSSKYSDQRLRLISLEESSCDGSIRLPPYQFEYTSATLPSTTSRAIDHWGYYNGQHGNEYENLNYITTRKLNIPPTTLEYSNNLHQGVVTVGTSNRESNESTMLQGMLKKIQFPTGGFHELEFEANRYIDHELGTTVCGGVRIKKTTIDSGDGTSPPIIKSYHYPNQGQLIQQPLYGQVLNKTVENYTCWPDEMCVLTINYLSWNDGGFAPLSSFEGYHLYYNKVKEIYEDQAFSENTFANYSNPQPNFGKFPNIPFSYAPGTGQVKTEKLFNSTAQSVGETVYTYKQKLNAESAILVRASGIPYTIFNESIVINDGQNGNTSEHCCHNISGAAFFHSTYRIYTGYSLIEEKNSTIDGLKTKENYSYRADEKHLFPIQYTIQDPVMGSAAKTNTIKYAEAVQQTNFIASQMVARHLIGLPLETRIMDGAGGGSKVNYNVIDNYFKPIQFFQATAGSDYLMGNDDTADWKLMATASYNNGSDFPNTVQSRNSILPTLYNWETYGYGLLAEVKLGDRIASYQYNPNRQLEESTSPDGITQQYSFDDLGRLEQAVLDKTPSNTQGREIVAYTYSYGEENKIGAIRTFTDGLAPLQTEAVFDGIGRPLANRKLAFTQSGNDYVNTTAYNQWGLVDQECDPASGGCTSYEYESSPLRRVLKIKPAGTQKSILKQYSTENAFRRIATTDENGNTTITISDILGRQRKSIDALGAVTTFAYNDRDQATGILPPAATPAYAYTYHYFDDGLLKDKSVPDKGIYHYVYNLQDQMLKEELPNGTELSYEYDQIYNSFLRKVVKDQTIELKKNIPVNLSVSDRVLSTQDRIVGPDGFGAWHSHLYSYTPLGLVKTLTTNGIDGTAQENVFDYDALNNIIQEVKTITGPDGVALSPIQKNYLFPKGIRLRETRFSYGNQQQVLNQLDYNDKDYLITKQIGNGIQEIDYAYNGRGWLTNINSVQSTFDYGKACLPAPTQCDHDKEKTRLLRVSYHKDKLVNKEPTAIQLEKHNFEHNGQERTKLSAVTTQVPLNGFTDAKELNLTNHKNIYLTENSDADQVVAILTQEIAPYLSDYNPTEKDLLLSQLATQIATSLTSSSSPFQGKLFGMELFYESPNYVLNAPPQHNGNIAWVKWRVKGAAMQAYGFNYDANNRLTAANYGANNNTHCNLFPDSKYDVKITGYDARGNILGLTRMGLTTMTDDLPSYGLIDNLSYTGYENGSNLLSSVSDEANADGVAKGFTGSSSYGYDNTGNLISDSKKAINHIQYSYFDLPTRISTAKGEMHNYYDAGGNKLKTVVLENGKAPVTRHYLSEAEYENSQLQSIAHEEGRYVYDRNEAGDVQKAYFEYFLKDHLGNVRVRFADLNQDGEIQVLKGDPEHNELLAATHYYPFGMKMEGTWEAPLGVKNRYLYNGKELNEDFGLNWLDYGARWYDPAIGRWNAVDPLADSYAPYSPYNYTLNNPIRFIDPDGMRVDDIYVNQNGDYLGEDNKSSKEVRVMNKGLWDQRVAKDENGVATDSGTEYAQNNSTSLGEYEHGIAISDGTWNTIEGAGGEKMTPSVQNNSSGEALVLPEKFDKKTVVLESGEGYYPQADGVSTASSRAKGEVHKIGNGSKVEVTSSGKVEHVNWAPSRLVKSGKKGTSYLNSQAKDVKWDGHPTQQPNYNHWARLYGVPMKSPNTLVPTGSN